MGWRTIFKSTSSLQFEGGEHPKYPILMPKFWHGMTFPVLMSLLIKNGFQVSPSRLNILLTSLIITPINSCLASLTRLKYAARLRKVTPDPAPIFIIGHWRCGTTYLHELMMLDPSLFTPNSLQCFSPSYFPLVDRFFYKYMNWLIPKTRFFDQVTMGWTRPQEDEFALLALGAPSPYIRIAFPNTSSSSELSVDVDDYSPSARQRWVRKLTFFLRILQIRDRRRPVLKSPTHTARIKILSQIFPKAKFIHIVRDPRKFIPSTKRLWQSLYTGHSFQSGPYPRLDTTILSQFTHMYNCFNRDVSSLAPDRICQIRYEDLVSDPIASMRSIYESLKISEFSLIEPLLKDYLQSLPPYKTNKFTPDSSFVSRIEQTCSQYMSTYGY